MGADTKIQWADMTWNPWVGCQKVSPGCNDCYAARNTFVNFQRSQGRELWGNEQRSERHVTSAAYWRKPIAWNRQAKAAGERPRVFPSMCDPFEDRPDLVEPRARFLELIERTPHLDWLLLTKRPENVMAMVPDHWQHLFPRNVWLGTSAEDQERWDERVGIVSRMTAARLVFVSAEPLIGPIAAGEELGGVEWVIVGGESGPKARPMDLAWARDLVAECQRWGTAPFVKQLGRHPCNTTGAYYDLDDTKGGDWDEWPEDLRVREMPVAPAELLTTEA